MAEFIVKFVLTKLADAAVQEALHLYGVNAKVDAVSRELGRIQAFLKGADKKQITDEQQKHWVKEVRDIAYSIEDVIDTFLIEVPQQPQKSSGMMEKMKRKLKIAKKIPAVHKLLDEISLIQTKIEEIEKSRLRYGINNLGEGGGEIQLPIRPLILPDIDPEIIGFNKARDHIVKELLNKTTKKRYVVSIWGPGGLGKTTLAQKVYNSNDVKERFGVCIWVVISQNFQLIGILRKIMKQLDPDLDLNKQPEDVEAFLTMVHKSLRGKTYLIVFDDVWTNNLWIQIEAALPNDNNGSRILMTTRNSDVSKDADPTCEPYKLEYLTNELSSQLLLKKALPNHDPNNSAFDGLSEIMNQFVHKCGGLPLALVVVGGLLSKKPCNYNAWSKVLETMSWHVDGKKCTEIIGTSYEDLSFALKSCFMYFAAFPEDYEFQPSELIQMWIAEGFIQHEDNRTLEETAESFLEDLVQRSMVYVKSRSRDGSIEVCYIHDLLQDLAIQKAKEDKFLMVYSRLDDQQFINGARRVAVHHLDCDEHMLSQNLRTLLYFGNKYMPNCSKQRLLKVVNTGSSINTKIKLEMFEGLTQLRYLDLTGQPNDKWEGYLEKVIGGMKFLQTLYFAFGDKGLIPIPDSLWHINTLRHVTDHNSCKLPPSTKLTNLQTIPKVVVTESWETESPHLPNLRSLKLESNKSVSAGSVVTFLGTLEQLITLEIEGDHIPLHIFDMRCFPFYKKLQSLQIENTCKTPHEIAIDVSMFPPHLTYLFIRNYQFHQDVMSVLEKLPCLRVLCLYKVFTNKKLSCSAKCFNQLESLDLSGMTFEDWEIEDGAMPILRELKVWNCGKLCVPQGLRHLTGLQYLQWWFSDCGGKTDGEIMNLLKDVVPSNVEIDLR